MPLKSRDFDQKAPFLAKEPGQEVDAGPKIYQFKLIYAASLTF